MPKQRKSLVDAVTDAFYNKAGDGGASLLQILRLLATRYVSDSFTVRDAEDLIQDTCLKLVQLAQRNVLALDIANQVPKIMRNAAIDIHTSRGRDIAGLPEDDSVFGVYNAFDDKAAEALEEVIQAIRGLPDDKRVLILNKASGHSYAQIRTMLKLEWGIEVTENDLAVAVNRIRKRLRKVTGRGDK